MDNQERKDWLQSRCGLITASRIADVLAAGKGNKEATTRRNYRAELVCERLTGKARESFISYDMQRGIELEPLARSEYEIRKNVILDTCGLIAHPTMQFAGASPDALIGKDGMAQFKCPKTAIHLEWLRAGIVPAEHRPQMLWEMACTQRAWNDFVSYDQYLPEHLQLFVVRLPRDNAAIAELEREVKEFNDEVEALIAELPKEMVTA